MDHLNELWVAGNYVGRGLLVLHIWQTHNIWNGSGKGFLIEEEEEEEEGRCRIGRSSALFLVIWIRINTNNSRKMRLIRKTWEIYGKGRVNGEKQQCVKTEKEWGVFFRLSLSMSYVWGHPITNLSLLLNPCHVLFLYSYYLHLYFSPYIHPSIMQNFTI